MGTIYLIRHGEITQSMPRCFVGQRDVPLTARGQEQMAWTGRFLAGQGVASLVCSPLSRCVHSAEILGAALGCTPEIVPDLREVSLGAWEGLTVEEVQERFPGAYEARGKNLADIRPLGGESFADVQDRAWPAFTATTALHPVAIVAHSGVNRVLLCRILGLPLQHMFRFGQEYACVNILGQDADGYRVETLNLHPGCQQTVEKVTFQQPPSSGPAGQRRCSSSSS